MQHDHADIVVAHHAVHPKLDVIGAIAGQFRAQHTRAKVEAAKADLANSVGSVGPATQHRALADSVARDAGIAGEHRHVAAHLEAESSLGVGVTLRVSVASADSLHDHWLVGRQAVIGHHPAVQIQRPPLVAKRIALLLAEGIVLAGVVVAVIALALCLPAAAASSTAVAAVAAVTTSARGTATALPLAGKHYSCTEG